MKEKEIIAYKKIVLAIAEMSSCKRLKVGAILVKDNSIISYGYNGTPYGDDNDCECSLTGLSTNKVIHAENNALLKCAASHASSRDSVCFVSHSPCIYCSIAMYQAGISEVYYINDYRLTEGIDFLQSKNINVTKI